MTTHADALLPVEVLYMYAHEDQRLRKGLDKHLSAMKQQGLISVWHDADMQAGAERSDEIAWHLETCRIVLLLISPDFLASKHYDHPAIKRLLERHETGAVHVIPVLLRPVDRKGTPFERLRCLPSNGIPVTGWPNRDKAFVDIADHLRMVVEAGQVSAASALPTSAAGTAQVQQMQLPPDIPDERYYPLPGREQYLHTLLRSLQETSGPPIIVIDGLGGLGKTALAIELARRAFHQGLFEKVIGESAQQELFTGGEIIHVRDAVLDFERLLDSLARQLGYWELSSLKLEEKVSFLVQHMRRHRYLLVVDNLEAVENAQVLVARLRDFLGTCRAIITSRQKVRHDFVRMLSLQGLDLEDALFFMTRDIEQRGIQQLQDLSREKMIEIYTVTGGAPLAMKLVIAQARFLDLELVLERLRQAGSNLYAFIFYQSWQNLSPSAQRVLIYIGRTVTTTVGWPELASVSIASSEELLMAAIEQLVAYSLLDISSTTGQARYGIHQLTRLFINSDLPELWRKQGLR